MSFRFALEPLLRLRRNLEKAEERRLEGLHAEAVRLQESIHSLREMRRTECAVCNTRMRHGLPSEEIQLTEIYAQALAFRENELMTSLQKNREDINRQILALGEARRHREILEKLRDRRLAESHLVQNRKEQQSVDDLFLQRSQRG